MRLLLVLALVALSPFLPGTAVAPSWRGAASEAQPSVRALADHPEEHARGTRSIGFLAEIARVGGEGTARFSSPASPSRRVALRPARRVIARGSDLELGDRTASRGDHPPYFPAAPPRDG